MKLNDRLLLRLVPPIGAAAIRLIGRTMKIKNIGRPSWDSDYREREGVIFVFWHNRMLLMPLAARQRPVAVLISRHRDGELISRTMDRFGFISVRGSTTRGGRTALRRLPALLERGTDVAITPDGPKGPRYRVQPGAVQLARLSGRPIFPVTFAASRFRSFNSWDGFRVPGLFSRGVFFWGEPLKVSAEDDLEERRQALEDALNDITDRADDHFGAVAGTSLHEETGRRGA